MERRAAEPIKYLGMDKKSIGGGHRHATMLNNLEGGRVWEVLPDASKRMLRDSWEFYLAASARKSVPWPRTCGQPISRA